MVGQTCFHKRFQAKYWQIYLLMILVYLFPLAVLSQIISPQRFFGQYQQFVWQDQHGLPQNGISKIVQTPDGYLWLAIAEGVARFDGVRFTAFNTENTPEIKSNNVQALLADSKGTLWIGAHGGGLTSYQNGFFTHYTAEQGLTDNHVRSLFEDKSGNLWVGTDGGGLFLRRGGKFINYTVENGLPDNRVGAVGEDAEGHLWIGTNNGLARMLDEKFTVFTSKDGLAGNGIRTIFLDRDGTIWIGGSGGLTHYKNREFTAFGEKDGFQANDVWSIVSDREGTMWIGTVGNGVYRLKNGKFEGSNKQDGLINNYIQDIFPDREGNVWLGTSGGGLAELKTGRFGVFTKSEGLPDDMIGAVFKDNSGAVWVGTDEGLSRYKDGKFTEVKTSEGQSIKRVNSINQDLEGNLWIASNGDIDNQFVRSPRENSTVEVISAKEFFANSSFFLQDRSGNIWVDIYYGGVKLIKPDGSETAFSKAKGLADDFVSVLYEDKEGSLWVGTRGGLSRFKDGQLTTFKKAEGFTENLVLSIREDSRGNLWIGTDGDGLFRFRDGKFNVFTSKNGLYDNLAFSILEDDYGNLWMSGNKGIYRANIIELEEFADGRRKMVNSFSYGSFDGMLSRECNGANPAGTKANDGRIWFPTLKGVVVVNPNVLDDKPPMVSIEKVLIDNQGLPNSEEITIQPNQNDLEIQFTALSWNRPSQIKFKYQLVGLDKDWVDAGTRRTAYYSHITPGEYTFRVIADNGEGIWNYTGQQLTIVVLPPFYQTWWFYLLSALATALIIRLIYNYRLAQLKQLNEAKTLFTQQLIENQEQERKRIAVELHDSIGQNLIVIRNRALLGLNTPEKQDRLIAQMEEISESAADSITEVRRISQNLHPYQIEHLGLTTAIETMIETTAEASVIEFEKEIDSLDEVMPKDAEINLYRIVQESLNNILKHSEATKAKVIVRKDDNLLRVLIEDNGKGFNTEYLSNAKDGLGLTGIRERAKMLGAKFEISSIPNQGTTVSLKIELPPN